MLFVEHIWPVAFHKCKNSCIGPLHATSLFLYPHGVSLRPPSNLGLQCPLSDSQHYL